MAARWAWRRSLEVWKSGSLGVWESGSREVGETDEGVAVSNSKSCFAKAAARQVAYCFILGTTNLTNYTNLAWLATSFLTAKKDEMRERKTWVADSFLTTEKTEYTEVLGLLIHQSLFYWRSLSYLVFGV